MSLLLLLYRCLCNRNICFIADFLLSTKKHKCKRLEHLLLLQMRKMVHVMRCVACWHRYSHFWMAVGRWVARVDGRWNGWDQECEITKIMTTTTIQELEKSKQNSFVAIYSDCTLHRSPHR